MGEMPRKTEKKTKTIQINHPPPKKQKIKHNRKNTEEDKKRGMHNRVTRSRRVGNPKGK